jgi:hypothetical protein
MKIDEEMALLFVKFNKTYFKIQKIIKRNAKIHWHGGNPLTKYPYAEFCSLTNVKDCWLSY